MCLRKAHLPPPLLRATAIRKSQNTDEQTLQAGVLRPLVLLQIREHSCAHLQKRIHSNSCSSSRANYTLYTILELPQITILPFLQNQLELSLGGRPLERSHCNTIILIVKSTAQTFLLPYSQVIRVCILIHGQSGRTPSKHPDALALTILNISCGPHRIATGFAENTNVHRCEY